MPPPTPDEAVRQCGVFRIDQAEAAGWTEAMLQTAVRKGVVDRLWRGVYAIPVAPGAEGANHRVIQLSVGAVISHADLAVSHLAAAATEGLPFWAANPRACVTSPETSQSSASGVHVHRCAIPVEEFAGFRRFDTTSPARTVIDIAREFGVESGLVTADAALHDHRLTRADLAESLGRAAGRPGVKAARAVLDLADARAESPLESRSRFRIGRSGLPVPRSQAVVLDADGRFVARVDFLWEELGVVGEADGRAKYVRDMTRRSEEGRRREALERLGLLYESWGWEDLESFEPTAVRLRATLSRAAVLPGRRRGWQVQAEPS